MSDDDTITVTIEGSGPTVVDALADVLVNAQERLREDTNDGGT